MESNFKNKFFIPDNKIDLILGKKEKEQKEILYCIFHYQNFSKLPEKISKNVEDLIKCIVKDLETIQKKKNAGRQGGIKKQENLQEFKKTENENIDNKGMSDNSASSKSLADNKQTSSTLTSKNLATPYKVEVEVKDKYKIKEVEEKEKYKKEIFSSKTILNSLEKFKYWWKWWDNNDDEEMDNWIKEKNVSTAVLNRNYESLINYCESKGKTYKNYKSALKNFILLDISGKWSQK